MKFCILTASPRANGNTAELLKPFVAELEKNGAETEYVILADKKIKACKGCHACQNIEGEYGCPQKDDTADIIEKIIASDCAVFATPIYTWFCTAPMKALLDRLYGMNKFYGSAKGSLWKNKKIALITTHGYNAEFATQPFENAIKNLCKHSGLKYAGMYSVKDEDDLASFKTKEAAEGAQKFAQYLISIN